MSFQFKQFNIIDERCAMKVGTDGVLLGAVAHGGQHILDIGTGSGLVAMMMAQRFPDAKVTGIDIDLDACNQAKDNAVASPFSDRIEVINESLEDFALDNNGKTNGNEERLYDSIVCNPPFFENSMSCPDEQRTKARHSSSLPFSSLISISKALLSDDGVMTIIIPSDLITRIEEECAYESMFIVAKLHIKTVERKTPKRSILSIMKKSKPCNTTTQLLMENGQRSEWYQRITQDFYIR